MRIRSSNVSQILTLDQSDLDQRLGRLDGPALRALDAGLSRVLGL